MVCATSKASDQPAYAQTDQSFCWSLEYSMHVKLLTEHHLEILRLKEGYTGSSESTLVKMSNCWKSHAETHYWYYLSLRPSYWLTQESDCTDCDPGYYCPDTNQTASVLQCSAGYYCTGKSTEAMPINQTYGDKCPTGKLHFISLITGSD